MKGPGPNELSDDSNQGQQKQEFERLSGALAQLLGGSAEATYTIDGSDVIKPTVGLVAVDTAAGAVADNLARITGEDSLTAPGLPDGSLVILRSVSSARVVTVKHLAGGPYDISLVSGADFVLNDPKKRLVLERRGTQWFEVDRSFGGDAAAERSFLGLTQAATVTNPANPGDNGKAIIAQSGILGLGTPTSTGGPTHRLRVDRTSDQTLGPADLTWRQCQFNVVGIESSAGNLWDPATHEIKIPSGISYIRVTATLQVGTTTSPASWWSELFLFRKPSGGSYPANPDGHPAAGLLSASIQHQSPPTASVPISGQSGEIAVSAGDRFKLMERGSGGGTRKILGASKPAYCWLSVELFA